MSASRTEPTAIDLDKLIAVFGGATNLWETIAGTQILARARLADACRDFGIRPITEAAFQDSWKKFDERQQRRFCLLISGLDLPEVAQHLPDHCKNQRADTVVLLFTQLTKQLEFLTLDVLRQSDVRLEEFARHFCAAWGMAVQGERPEQSKARLHDIDFGRLMREAHVARSSAEERLAYLRELQKTEEETRRPRRGKW